MRLGWRELTREPGRFIPAGAALTLVVVLLVVLGGFLDGLYRGSTGTIRALDADLITYDDTSRLTLERSRVVVELREEVAATDGVASADGVAVLPTSARDSATGAFVDVALVAFAGPTDVLTGPPDAGLVYADRRLERVADITVGDVLRIGSDGPEVEIVGWVEDASYLLQPTLWMDATTWREAAAAARPDAVLPDGASQALVIGLDDGTDPDVVADRIDERTGSTETVTPETAIASIGGVEEQTRTFQLIIVVTLGIAGLVVALFFALLTLERQGLYAALKAIGATDRDLVATVTVQAFAVAGGAFIVGTVIALALAPIVPPDLPVEILPFRLAVIGGGMLAAALVGAATTLRRLLRVDPAEALG